MSTEQMAKLSATVADCYSFMDLARLVGIKDLTEGIYNDDPSTPYDVAQKNQISYLLDQICCREKSSILDIGCGNGTLLEAAEKRGALAQGITISPEQVQICRRKKLHARLLSWQQMMCLKNNDTPTFDGIIANGSIEHFVQAEDAALDRANEIYQMFFRICREIIKTGCFMATTVIHFEPRKAPNPNNLLQSPFSFRWGSDQFHFGLIHQTLGGWYPVPGQLAFCADGLFKLTRQIDGTKDYHLTSEEWLRRVRKGLLTNPSFVAKLLGQLVWNPGHSTKMLFAHLIARSWNWQFRGEYPPTRLLRQTWQAV